MSFFLIGIVHACASGSAIMFFAAVAQDKPIAAIISAIASVVMHAGAASLTCEEAQEREAADRQKQTTPQEASK